VSNALHFEWTALHFSALEDDAATIGLLVAAGADVGLKDALGRTPLQLAEEHRKDEAIKELRKRRK
jgi:ankyrin repeat protein